MGEKSGNNIRNPGRPADTEQQQNIFTESFWAGVCARAHAPQSSQYSNWSYAAVVRVYAMHVSE